MWGSNLSRTVFLLSHCHSTSCTFHDVCWPLETNVRSWLRHVSRTSMPVTLSALIIDFSAHTTHPRHGFSLALHTGSRFLWINTFKVWNVLQVSGSWIVCLQVTSVVEVEIVRLVAAWLPCLLSVWSPGSLPPAGSNKLGRRPALTQSSCWFDRRFNNHWLLT